MTETRRDQKMHGADAATPHESSIDPTGARSFSRGLGFFLQGIGAAMLLIMTCTCCGFAFIEAGIWQTSGEADVVLRDEQGRPTGQLAPPDEIEVARQRANATLMIGTAVGGLCLVGFGVGMQSDRGLFPAIGASVSTMVMMILYGWVTIQSVSVSGLSWTLLVAGGLAVVFALLAVLSLAAVNEVMRTPPASSEAPTVPADAFPDPWADTEGKSSGESSAADRPTRRSIARQRERLQKQLEELDELERRFGDEKSADQQLPEHDSTEKQ